MKYNLSHLKQKKSMTIGPIQDDEALFLYSLVRVMGLRNILEVGGLNGYSARNFLSAISLFGGFVFTIEPNIKLKPIDKKHIVIHKLAHDVGIDDLKNISKIDLIFFDAHDTDSQMELFNRLVANEIIDHRTVVALHDTGTHPRDIMNTKHYVCDNINNGNNGYIHQISERTMSNSLMDMGYCPLHLHIDNQKLPIGNIVMRHGLTILSKPYRLQV